MLVTLIQTANWVHLYDYAYKTRRVLPTSSETIHSIHRKIYTAKE